MPLDFQDPLLDAMNNRLVFQPESIFMIGASMEHVSEDLRALDKIKNLGLGSILHAQPPYWVHMPELYTGRRMVSIGEYLEFIKSDMPGIHDPSKSFYNDRAVWDEVWQMSPIERSRVSHKLGEANVVDVEDFYRDAHNFVDAYLKSIRFESLAKLGMSLKCL
jgi:hypothetical protein